MDIIAKLEDPAGISFLQIQLTNGKIIEIREMDDDTLRIANPRQLNDLNVSKLTIDGKTYLNCVTLQ
jgi:hypothetical protein